MTAEIFPALDLPPIKIQDNAPMLFKIKAASKLFQVQRQNCNAYFQALFERLKPIPLEKITRRLCKLY